MLLRMDDELEALAILRADICKLWPPGPVRERWLAWAELVVAADSWLSIITARSERDRPEAAYGRDLLDSLKADGIDIA
jgi:hypothetical protein